MIMAPPSVLGCSSVQPVTIQGGLVPEAVAWEVLVEVEEVVGSGPLDFVPAEGFFASAIADRVTGPTGRLFVNAARSLAEDYPTASTGRSR
jgi:hypothetical protein